MKTRLGIMRIATLFLLWLTVSAHAQVLGTGVLPVTEVGANLTNGIVTALQSTISAVEDVVQTAAALDNLVPLDTIETAEGIIEDMEELDKIMKQADQLSNDVASLQRQVTALFHLDNTPGNTSALQERLREIRRMRYEAWTHVVRMQTLGRTVQRTVKHLTGLLKSISAFLGNKQAQQSIAQMNATMSKTLAIQAAQRAAHELAAGYDKLEELMTDEAMHRIMFDGCERCRMPR